MSLFLFLPGLDPGSHIAFNLPLVTVRIVKTVTQSFFFFFFVICDLSIFGEYLLDRFVFFFFFLTPIGVSVRSARMNTEKVVVFLLKI